MTIPEAIEQHTRDRVSNWHDEHARCTTPSRCEPLTSIVGPTDIEAIAEMVNDSASVGDGLEPWVVEHDTRDRLETEIENQIERRGETMKERPIIMTGESVRAILDGRKTQTRRVIKPQPPAWATDLQPNVGPWVSFHGDHPEDGPSMWTPRCPYGKPGDLLWVRETHWRNTHPDRVFVEQAAFERHDKPDRIWLNGQRSEHTRDRTALIDESGKVLGYDWWVKRSPIFMPKWAARIWLRVTDLRVERVQEISEADAIAEGCPPASYVRTDISRRLDDYRSGFAAQWDTINAKRGFGWDANPWVWVVTFETAER